MLSHPQENLMSHTVTATFKTTHAAQAALNELDRAGFTEEQISVISTDNSLGQSFNIETHTKATEGAGVGAGVGGLIGAIAAGLAATGSVVIPGVNLVVFGTLVAAAAGAGTGALTGGLVGALIGAGIPEYEAKRYEDEVKKGAILIAVETGSSERAKLAKDIFEREDAHNIAA